MADSALREDDLYCGAAVNGSLEIPATIYGDVDCSQGWDRPSGFLKGRVRILK